MQNQTVILKRHNIKEILSSCSPALAEKYRKLDESLLDVDQKENQPAEVEVQPESPETEDEPASKFQILEVTGPLTGKTLKEDVSYIIIRTEGLDDLIEHRRRRASTTHRADGRPINVNGPFECMQPSSFVPNGTCQQVFFSCCKYSLHYREEHTKRKKSATKCQVCEKDLGPEDDRPTFPCNACEKVFHDPQELDGHRRAMHIKVRPFECGVCQKRFTQHGGLQQHTRMHTGDRPFACLVCGKRFSQHGGLQQHMRMHTGDRPFPCNFCAKRFTQKAGLDQHLRTHTKVKPFQCIVCWKSFSQSVHLKQHMRTHTQIHPFECGVCSRRFKQSGHLNVHLKSHTEAEVRLHEAGAGRREAGVVLVDGDVPANDHQEEIVV